MTENATLLEADEKIFLNVGCGTTGMDRVPEVFKAPNWQQVRVDIDARVQPDIVASFSDMRVVSTDTVDAIYSSHNIEHMPWHQVQMALREARRILKAEGFLYLTCPDLEHIAQLIIDGKLTETAYNSPAGPITALDMLYGHSDAMARGNDYMAHRCGFTTESLGRALMEAGFSDLLVSRGAPGDLWAIASNQPLSADIKADFVRSVGGV